MTKKHFELFAETIKNKFGLDRPWNTLCDGTQTNALAAVDCVVQVAMQSNPRFDARRFRAACGVPA